MLDQSELDVLRASVLILRESNEDAAVVFYETLFEQSPELRDLFPAQMTDQARKFSATLIVAVNFLADWQSLKPIIETLARRHLAYGVKFEHYELVGQALIATLQKFGTSPNDIAVWRKIYAILSDHMKATAYPLTTRV